MASGSGTGSVASNKTSKVTITGFGLQANTDRTLFVTWSWSKKHTKHYEYEWWYTTGDGVWFKGEEGTTKDKQSQSENT